MPANIKELQSFYNGFFLTRPVGNNAFSFELRQNQAIYVAPLRSDNSALAIGKHIAFSEIDDGVEINRAGLAAFHYLQRGEKDIFIFDNHNHAFSFWMWGVRQGRLKPGKPLLHIDQHSDMREPPEQFVAGLDTHLDLPVAFEYANFVLNVGNFIKPALASGLFSGVQMITGSDDFDKPLPKQFVLDVDIDVFAPEMDYIPKTKKLQHIQSCIERAQFITIATSPFFIEQSLAIKIVQELLAPFV